MPRTITVGLKKARQPSILAQVCHPQCSPLRSSESLFASTHAAIELRHTEQPRTACPPPDRLGVCFQRLESTDRVRTNDLLNCLLASIRQHQQTQVEVTQRHKTMGTGITSQRDAPRYIQVEASYHPSSFRTNMLITSTSRVTAVRSPCTGGYLTLFRNKDSTRKRTLKICQSPPPSPAGKTNFGGRLDVLDQHHVGCVPAMVAMASPWLSSG